MHRQWRARYTLYMYSAYHWAIDCDQCNVKVANFTPNELSGTILDKLNAHSKRFHQNTESREL